MNSSNHQNSERRARPEKPTYLVRLELIASGKDIRDPGCFLGARSGKPPLGIRF
jgi:hypothetical protein